MHVQCDGSQYHCEYRPGTKYRLDWLIDLCPNAKLFVQHFGALRIETAPFCFALVGTKRAEVNKKGPPLPAKVPVVLKLSL